MERRSMTKKNGNSLETKVAVIATNIDYLKEEVSEIKAMIGKNFITRDEFEPVKRITYGLVALILIAVIGALLSLIIKR